ncbi:hypothetical protein BOTNAR_0618g00050 [Botryotinia narcissicola]|uniref:Uncharacterized protein n=1 Tax=Botryotinia narcissicola TaxID=278944 RepID=A0A4Z1HA69_9HELO|nr:hypothetical protein BOTNAR_0618g00050 [Botryotinia narcissicola]
MGTDSTCPKYIPPDTKEKQKPPNPKASNPKIEEKLRCTESLDPFTIPAPCTCACTHPPREKAKKEF